MALVPVCHIREVYIRYTLTMNSPPPLDIAHGPPPDTLVRFIEFTCQFQLVHFESRIRVLYNFEVDPEGP